jgi:hypothetical protein
MPLWGNLILSNSRFDRRTVQRPAKAGTPNLAARTKSLAKKWQAKK